MKLLRNPATGKYQRKPNGKLIRGVAGDPCCCDSGFPCNDGTVLNVTVTVAGVTNCTCKFTGDTYVTMFASVNGTVTLTSQNSGNGQASVSSASCAIDYGPTPGCIITSFVHSSIRYTVTLGCSSSGGGTWSVTVDVRPNLQGSSTFRGVTSGTGLLPSSVVVNNDATACTSGTARIGYGGTATVTFS